MWTNIDDHKVTELDMIRTVRNILSLKNVNMKLNPKKFSFGMEEGKFLGYIVTSERIRAYPEKTKVVMNMPSPNVKNNLIWEFWDVNFSEMENSMESYYSAQRDKEMPKEFGTPLQSIFKTALRTYQQQPSKLLQTTRTGLEDTTPMCNSLGHSALTAGIWALCKGCRKPKRVKDYCVITRKKMTLEAHYRYMAMIQYVHLNEPVYGQPLEQKDDSNVTPDSSNICTNDNQVDQNAAECVDERAALANLIANLTLDTEENKTILKQLQKAIAY
ncbi:hypothetical protein Tco_0563608 [Tanacetum coccineum]